MTEPLLGDYSRAQKRQWSGVYCDNGTCEIKPARVDIRLVTTPNCDGNPVIASHVTYQPENPVFLIDHEIKSRRPIVRIDRDSNTSELNLEGPVTRDSRSGGTLWPLKRGSLRYQVLFPEPYSRDGDKCIRKGHLPIKVLRNGRVETVWGRQICAIAPLDIPDEFGIRWAGDVDGDAKLDLLITLPQQPLMLLLSSKPPARSLFSPRFPNKPSC